METVIKPRNQDDVQLTLDIVCRWLLRSCCVILLEKQLKILFTRFFAWIRWYSGWKSELTLLLFSSFFFRLDLPMVVQFRNNCLSFFLSPNFKYHFSRHWTLSATSSSIPIIHLVRPAAHWHRALIKSGGRLGCHLQTYLYHCLLPNFSHKHEF